MLMNVNNTNVFSEPHLVPDDEGRWSGGEEGGAAVELPLVEHASQAHLVEKIIRPILWHLIEVLIRDGEQTHRIYLSEFYPGEIMDSLSKIFVVDPFMNVNSDHAWFLIFFSAAQPALLAESQMTQKLVPDRFAAPPSKIIIIITN